MRSQINREMWESVEHDFVYLDAHSRSPEDVRATVAFVTLQQQLSAREAELKPR